MIFGVCDTPDRLPALIFRWQLGRAGGCPCCAFWRGVVLGVVVGIVLTIAFIFVPTPVLTIVFN